MPPNMTIECCPNVDSLTLYCDLGTDAISSSYCTAKSSPKRSTKISNSHAPITPNVKESTKRRSAEGDSKKANSSSPVPSNVLCNGHTSSNEKSEAMPEASSKPEDNEPILSESEDRFVMYPVRYAAAPTASYMQHASHSDSFHGHRSIQSCPRV